MKKPRNASINTKCCGNSENRKGFFELSLSLIFSLWCLVLLFYSMHGLSHGNGCKWISFSVYPFCYLVLVSAFVLLYFSWVLSQHLEYLWGFPPFRCTYHIIFLLLYPLLLVSVGFSSFFWCPFLSFDFLKTHFFPFPGFSCSGKSISRSFLSNEYSVGFGLSGRSNRRLEIF